MVARNRVHQRVKGHREGNRLLERSPWKLQSHRTRKVWFCGYQTTHDLWTLLRALARLMLLPLSPRTHPPREERKWRVLHQARLAAGRRQAEAAREGTGDCMLRQQRRRLLV